MTTNEDDFDDDSHASLTQAYTSLQMGSADDVEPDVRSLHPTLPSNSHDGFKSSQRQTCNPTRIICGFCEEPCHHQDDYIKCGPCFWPDWHAKKGEQLNATCV